MRALRALRGKVMREQWISTFVDDNRQHSANIHTRAQELTSAIDITERNYQHNHVLSSISDLQDLEANPQNVTFGT